MTRCHAASGNKSAQDKRDGSPATLPPSAPNRAADRADYPGLFPSHTESEALLPSAAIPHARQAVRSPPPAVKMMNRSPEGSRSPRPETPSPMHLPVIYSSFSQIGRAHV